MSIDPGATTYSALTEREAAAVDEGTDRTDRTDRTGNVATTYSTLTERDAAAVDEGSVLICGRTKHPCTAQACQHSVFACFTIGWMTEIG